MILDESYKAIPVSVAEAIALQYEKSQVIILGYDPKYEATHTVTYGVTAFDKENAAAAGKMATAAIGCDLSNKLDFEDFHQDYDPALYKEAVDLLVKAFTRNDGSPHMISQIEKFLKTIGRHPRQG